MLLLTGHTANMGVGMNYWMHIMYSIKVNDLAVIVVGLHTAQANINDNVLIGQCQSSLT